MGRVVLAVSLDGFTAGPKVRETEPMGDGGERLRLHLVPLLLDAGTPLFDGGSRPS
jgi:hypothetical protein